MKYSFIHLLVVFFFIPLIHCAGHQANPVYVKNGKTYGTVEGSFRHRWWNFYERGLSYAEGNYYHEAVSDLITAANIRDKDQRMARTYGMHFIDFFPHRELGVLYYRMGKQDDAKRELELSLTQFPSAKARFYLDRARKAILELKAPDTTPPDLTLGLKNDKILTRDYPVILSGVASDDKYISFISIGGVPLFLDGAKKSIPFSKKLELSQGRHSVEVLAKNLTGNVTKRKVLVHIDREGPMITLTGVRVNNKSGERFADIEGIVYDDIGVKHISINGKRVSKKTAKEITFRSRINNVNDRLELISSDILGNTTTAVIPLNNIAKKTAPLLLASSQLNKSLIASLFGEKDKIPPKIRLRGWEGKQTVYLEKIYIAGEVTDENLIEMLIINGESVLRHSGQRVYFSHLAELKKGENTITIETRDENGNEGAKTINVLRKVPKVMHLSERMRLSVFPFSQKGTVSKSSLFFQDFFTNDLVNRNRFQIVEREKLDLILNEQKLSRTELVDRKTALRLGKLVAAQAVITGTIIETNTGIEIVGRMVDSETSEILASEDVYDEVKEISAMRSLSEGLAIKFHREFPLVEGIVVRQKGKSILTDIGSDRITINRRLIVFREEPVIHPVTGKTLGSDNTILGRARVTQVMEGLSKAAILDNGEITVNIMDKVISE